MFHKVFLFYLKNFINRHGVSFFAQACLELLASSDPYILAFQNTGIWGPFILKHEVLLQSHGATKSA